MPEITVRSFAELVRLPAYEQERILHEQKYPKAAPHVFKAPYYQTALSGIRAHYATSGSAGALASAIAKAKGLRPTSRGQHNLRALAAFRASPQAKRALVPTSGKKMLFPITDDLDLRLRFDIAGTERGIDWRILYNFRNAELDKEVAELTLQISHWILAQAGAQARIPSLQYVDLASGRVFEGKRPSAKTIRLSKANARIISTLWPTI